MIIGQEVMERTNSPAFCWRSTSKGSFSTVIYGCSFHSFSVWYFCKAFSSETACRLPWTTWRTAVWETLF
jgi:hypothetical protein